MKCIYVYGDEITECSYLTDIRDPKVGTWAYQENTFGPSNWFLRRINVGKTVHSRYGWASVTPEQVPKEVRLKVLLML